MVLFKISFLHIVTTVRKMKRYYFVSDTRSPITGTYVNGECLQSSFMTGLGKKRSVFQNWVDEFLQLDLMNRVVVFIWVIEISSLIHLEWLQKAKGSIHTHTDNRITLVGEKKY